LSNHPYSARNKLNALYFIGCIVLAAVIGVALASWTVFETALVVLLIAALTGGDIRLAPGDRRR